MKPTAFEGSNCQFAEEQDEYLTLPAHRSKAAEGVVTTCWMLTWRERLRALIRGRIWLQQMTFHGRLQPQLPAMERPELEVSCQRCRDTGLVDCQGCDGKKPSACACCRGAGVIECRSCPRSPRSAAPPPAIDRDDTYNVDRREEGRF